jgi:hypothetical protein
MTLAPATSPRPLWRECTLVRNGEAAYVCERPTFYREADQHRLAKRAAYYNGLQAAWPGVHLYVVPVLPAADWCAVGGLYGPDPARHLVGDRYVREFRSRLDPGVGYTWVAENCSCQEALSYRYRTDHHWTPQGAYRVYHQLWGLLHRQNARMSPPYAPKDWRKVPDVIFHGGLAHRAGCYDAIDDRIVDGVFDLPPLETRIHGLAGRERNDKRRYQAGQHEKAKFANHYAAYFGLDYGLIEYTASDVRGGNLLVISDSYDNCIEPLLAAHFSRAWFLDLRHYVQDLGTECHLEDFLGRHQITDLLFLGHQSWVLGLPPETYGQP